MLKTMGLGILLVLSAHASAAVDCRISQQVLSSLDANYVSGQFRIYYSTQPQSPDFISDQTDLNQNHIPDYVENIAIQANASSEALTQLGFMHPLDSPRYQHTAEFIDIHVLAIKGNGLAFEMPIRYIHQANKSEKCALIIQVKNNLKQFPGNWTTINHELFHLYQYGYSQFKGGWYLEGMSNLIERLLRKGSQGGSGLIPLPSTIEQLQQQVYTVPYNQLWHRLAVLSDPTEGQLNLPQTLLDRRYIDGSQVFKDDRLKGHAFIKTVLENMQLQSDLFSKQNHWDQYNWAEAEQVSAERRPMMLKAIQDSMRQLHMTQTAEEIDFLQLK